MGRAILVLSRLEQLHEILQRFVDADLIDCEISILIPGSDGDAVPLPGLDPLLESGDGFAAFGEPRDQASANDVVGMLRELGVPPGDAAAHGRCLRKGAVLISVRCAAAAMLARVREISHLGGAELISDPHD